MFIGHYGVGLAARKFGKLPSLAMIFIAVQLMDLLWPVFCILGIESFEIQAGNTKMTPLNFTYYPYSHSLLMSCFWGILLGGTYFMFTKDKRSSAILAALVVSHWFLDLLVHRPDLPLTPFSETKLGLGLWNYPPLETVIEFGIFIVGTIIYYKYGKPQRRLAFWLLIAFLVIIHLLNIFGPPPPSIMAVAWAGNLMWIFVAWAWWIERKGRDVESIQPGSPISTNA